MKNAYIYIWYGNFFFFALESTILNSVNPSRNWTFQLIARGTVKKERNGKNKKSDTRMATNPGPRLVAPTLYRLSYGVTYIYIYIQH